MKRIIRLTESDLTRIVRRVLSEQTLTPKSDMIGKTFKLNGKMCKVEKALQLPNDGGVLILPDAASGCRKNNGVVGDEVGYIYLGSGNSVMSMFNWDMTTNNWKDLGDGKLSEPRNPLGSIGFVATESYRRRNY